MRNRLSAAVVAILLTLVVSPAAAQQDNVIAVGVSFTTRQSQSPTASNSTDVGLAWRLGHGATGWGLATGLGWFVTDISQPVAGVATELGELHVRPFMAGYGYTYNMGRASISAELLGGFAWVTFAQMPTAADVYRDRLGARALDMRASNTVILRPQTNLWIDMSDKIGLNVSAAYPIARPRLTTTSSLGEHTQRIRADMFAISAGIVYRIF